MAKSPTKAQAKRLVRDIESKTKKLFFRQDRVISIQDMAAIEKLCAKWMNRLK